MGWLVYFLVRYQDVISRLREEVMAAFPEPGSEGISFTQLHQLKYMHNIISETIRIVGIIPMNERAAVRDTTLPRGGGPDGQSPVFVPKGQQILIPTYSMQHSEDLWGADHDEFKPERWKGRQHGWDFIPFGSGIRQCLGREYYPRPYNRMLIWWPEQFARTEAMYVLVRLLQEFDTIENMESADTPMKFRHTIENRSGTGVQVRLHSAKSEIQAIDDYACVLDVERSEAVS